MLPVCCEDPWPALNGRWSWKLWEGMTCDESHVLYGSFEVMLNVHGLPPFLSHLFFMTRYHCVSGFDFLSPLIICQFKRGVFPA